MNSGIADTKTLLAQNAARERNMNVLARRERFAKKHPEVKIRAEREGQGPLAFYVTGKDYVICWLDASAMMNWLEAEYDALSEDGGSNDR